MSRDTTSNDVADLPVFRELLRTSSDAILPCAGSIAWFLGKPKEQHRAAALGSACSWLTACRNYATAENAEGPVPTPAPSGRLTRAAMARREPRPREGGVPICWDPAILPAPVASFSARPTSLGGPFVRAAGYPRYPLRAVAYLIHPLQRPPCLSSVRAHSSESVKIAGALSDRGIDHGGPAATSDMTFAVGAWPYLVTIPAFIPLGSDVSPPRRCRLQGFGRRRSVRQSFHKRHRCMLRDRLLVPAKCRGLRTARPEARCFSPAHTPAVFLGSVFPGLGPGSAFTKRRGLWAHRLTSFQVMRCELVLVQEGLDARLVIAGEVNSTAGILRLIP